MSGDAWATTVEAFRTARFAPVALVGEPWRAIRKSFSSSPPTTAEYVDALGPFHSLTISFGQLSLGARWATVETTTRGEYGRVDPGNGYTQVFTYDSSAEDKARNGLYTSVGFRNQLTRLVAEESGIDTPPLPEALDLMKHTPAEKRPFLLDGTEREFCVVQTDGALGASATLPDRTVTIFGWIGPEEIELQTVTSVDDYLENSRGGPASR